MKRIGLIGGMSFESTAVYYERLNRLANAKAGGFTSAELLLHSVDFAPIVTMQKEGRWHEAGERLADIAENLQRAGADLVLLCTNTMHKVSSQIRARISIPFLDIIDCTADEIVRRGCRRPLLLATNYTMTDGFYQDHMRKRGIEIVTPAAEDRTEVHRIIFEELCAGKILGSSRDTLFRIIDRARHERADCVILGCTEICLILDPEKLALPGLDTTAIHCHRAIEMAFS
ncbi:aspartate/glutamate racemase family protein [Rhizobium alvei]|uniref:Aspartate/glutamate racemase family protein n=1 Tax=Rhizobium alvei TaxID=1132659 RepID=A0ABT8YI97_9HYPH|nr:aspartate/glutamate racemase family protein [Rhizobium alvei]MDO6963420.1 aspartate/glutamate racemase family protein [Rhizobium alvei]